MTRPEAILFDVDGTLVDSNLLHVAAWRTVFAQAGHDVPSAEIAPRIGMGGDLLVPDLLPDLDEAAGERLARRHGVVFKAHHMAAVRAFPQARALLARVQAAGMTVVLASSADAAEVARHIAELGADGLVDVLTTSDDAGTSKPAPDIFTAALAKAGVAAAAARVVGDTVWDARAAARAGIPMIGLLSGGNAAADLYAAGAVAVYADAAALLAGFDASPLAR